MTTLMLGVVRSFSFRSVLSGRVSFMGSFIGREQVSMEDQDMVEDMVKSAKVVIFSKTYCPYCKLAKDVFKKLKQKVTVYELDERDDGATIQAALGSLTGASSVPRVFVHGQFIGGGSDVEKMMKNGTLQPMLAG